MSTLDLIRETSVTAVSRPPSSRRLRQGAILALALGGLALAQALYIPAKAALAQRLLARAWTQTLASGAAAKPWPWADVTPVAEIALPAMNAHAIVLGGTSGEAMAFGPGLMGNAAALGAPGTAIIAGHRDTHLGFLARVKIGDVIAATDASGHRFLFRVSATRVARWDASGLDPAEGGPAGARLALVTCYPFEAVGHGPLRYIVIADRVSTR